MLSPKALATPFGPSHHLELACDTGTYMSAVIALFPPDTVDALVLAEFPNYRYVGGEIELLGMSVPEWARWVKTEHDRYRPGRSKVHGWCDENSQFKTELQHYGLYLRGNPRKLELRVEISREYFQNHRVYLAPWLANGVLAYELEHAVWPDDTNSAGRFERVKESDHTLDCLEHILSRRPRHKAMVARRSKSFLQQRFDESVGWRMNRPKGDPHLGQV